MCKAGQHNRNEGEERETHVGALRPLLHFTPPAMWMNDPNGLVFFKGEYHLFYQHHPGATDIGAMHWGHAVSEDLIHWRHLPIALAPDEHGVIFSGCAVVDWRNTSGLGVNGEPPLVALFTYHDAHARSLNAAADCESQGLAYSRDRGRTWTKHEGNPVLPNPGGRPNFRDPKVFWDAPREQWIMALAVGDGIEFFRSENLLAWTGVSRFESALGANGGVWECPDLFPMSLGDEGARKWVLLVSLNPGGPHGGSATQYFVGDFNGADFVLDDAFRRQLSQEGPQWIDWGSDNYAGVTWSDIPETDGRRLFIGWMSNWAYGRQPRATPWRGSMTIPRQLRLVRHQERYRLCSSPPDELENHLEPETQRVAAGADVQGKIVPLVFEAGKITAAFDIADLPAPIAITFANDLAEWFRVTYDPAENRFRIDRGAASTVMFDVGHKTQTRCAPRYACGETLELAIIVDHESVELFIDGGLTVITETVYPTRPFQTVSIEGKDAARRLKAFSARAFLGTEQTDAARVARKANAET